MTWVKVSGSLSLLTRRLPAFFALIFLLYSIDFLIHFVCVPVSVLGSDEQERLVAFLVDALPCSE